jgi:hypothetical protein
MNGNGLTHTPLPLAPVRGWLETIKASEFGGEVRVDRDSGAPLWVIGLSARLAGFPRRVSIDCLIASQQPPSVPIDSEVVLVDPTVTMWSRKDGKHGVTVRASGVVLASEVEVPLATAEPVERRAGLPTKPQAGEGK